MALSLMRYEIGGVYDLKCTHLRVEHTPSGASTATAVTPLTHYISGGVYTLKYTHQSAEQ